MKSIFGALVVAVIVGCGGDSTSPTVLATGAYDYTADVPFTKSDGTVGSTQYVGTLSITYATADSIAGTFQVAGYQPDTKLGNRQGDAYVLYAFTTPSTGTIAHRIRPDLGCTAGRVPITVNGTCTLSLR